MTVYCNVGPMKSGKTRKLIETGIELLQANKNFLCFKSARDTRDPGVICTRDESLPRFQAVSVYTTEEISRILLFKGNLSGNLSRVTPDRADCITIEQTCGTIVDITDLDAVLFDEVFMLDSQFIQLVQLLKRTDIDVYISTLRYDFRNQVFRFLEGGVSTIDDLLEVCEVVYTHVGDCDRCGGVGTRTQRLSSTGAPADNSSPALLVDENLYECRCIECYEAPV